MEQLVVDASVAVKWVVPEELSLNAVRLRSRYSFAAPDILYGEFTNTLWKKAARREIGVDDALYAVAALQRIDLAVTPSRLIAAEALELSIKLGHPAYDCFYLCTAALTGSRLVTADRRLLGRVSASADWSDLVLGLESF